MESRQVELVPHPLLRAGAEFPDLQLAHLVAQGLAGPGHITLDLGNMPLVLGFAPFILSLKDQGLLPGPSLRMQAGVDDQADGPMYIAEKHAEILVRIGVKPKLLAEALRVKRPALDVGI